MSIKRQLTLGATMLGVAISTGFLMQNGPTIAAELGFASSSPKILAVRTLPAPAEQNVVAPALPQVDVHVVSLDTPLPQDPATTKLPTGQDLGQRMAAVEPDQPARIPQSHNQISAFGLPCAVTLTATPTDDAMITLDLSAPCSDGAVVNITQGALKFSILTDSAGNAQVVVPALSDRPHFTAAFDNGAKVRTHTSVPDFATFDRTALMWQGRAGMHIHAFENGASYGSDGHISRAQTKGKASFLTVLGTPSIPGGWSAEILSARSDSSGVVRLHIEAEVTGSTCGREIRAQTLQDATTPVDLTLAIPGCDAIGDFLVLKNILHDIKLAANN